ncbi:unnamed protein product, partial [Symbiodinium necroappetens]
MGIPEKVRCHNRFAILSEPDEDQDEMSVSNDMFFDWDELEKTWSAMNEPWDLHDFAFMGRFSWSDECEKGGHSQYHAIRSIMRKAIKMHAKKERRLMRQHEQSKSSAFFDWDELDAAEENELSKRSNSWFDWDELSSAESMSK